MGLSSFSTTPLEEVIAAGEGVDLVLQLYVMQNRGASERLVRRAESTCSIQSSLHNIPPTTLDQDLTISPLPIEAGYKALFLTVDTPYLGRRFSETRNNFHLPPHLSLGNFALPNLESTPNRPSGGGAGTELPFPKPGENTRGGGTTRTEIVADKGLPGFGVTDEEGVVNANGRLWIGGVWGWGGRC